MCRHLPRPIPTTACRTAPLPPVPQPIHVSHGFASPLKMKLAIVIRSAPLSHHAFHNLITTSRAKNCVATSHNGTKEVVSGINQYTILLIACEADKNNKKFFTNKPGLGIMTTPLWHRRGEDNPRLGQTSLKLRREATGGTAIAPTEG